jgi:hypothetical protein
VIHGYLCGVRAESPDPRVSTFEPSWQYAVPCARETAAKRLQNNTAVQISCDSAKSALIKINLWPMKQLQKIMVDLKPRRGRADHSQG